VDVASGRLLHDVPVVAKGCDGVDATAMAVGAVSGRALTGGTEGVGENCKLNQPSAAAGSAALANQRPASSAAG